MLATSGRVLRIPLVAFAYLIEQLRHLPGARWVERHANVVVAVLLLAAFLVVAVSMAQRSPQRISLAELVHGDLAPMQTWIIVSGDLEGQDAQTSTYRYNLTDPAVPDGTLVVFSQDPLPKGHVTVSGTLIGGATRAVAGFAWLGQLRADPVLAREPDPPWAGIAMAAVGLFIAFGSRTSYPMFFREAAADRAPRRATLPVGVRREWPPTPQPAVPGTVVLQTGQPIELRAQGAEPQRLRIHSAHSSVEVGALCWLSEAEPVLVVRPAAGDIVLSFNSADERDDALAALLADARRLLT